MATGSARLRLCDARDESAALLVIGVQQAIDDQAHCGQRNNPHLEDRLGELLNCWRAGNGHIVHIRHLSRDPRSPYRSSQPGAEFKPCAVPRDNERVVTQHALSAFVGTELEIWLRWHGVSRLVIAGVATAHAVSTTVRHAACLDFTVVVPADACAGFEVTDRHGWHWSAQKVHDLSLALLDEKYADVTMAHEVVQHF